MYKLETDEVDGDNQMRDLKSNDKVHVDEQAPRLAPEKRDFTATYTLGATTRQITYY